MSVPRLTVRRRVLLLLGGVAATFVLLALGWRRNEAARSAALLEQQRGDTEHMVESIVELRRAPLSQFVRDYTFWDELVDYVAAPDPEWAATNFDEASSTFGIEGLFVFGPTGRPIYRFPDEVVPTGVVDTLPLDASRFNETFGGEPFTHFFAKQGNDLLEVHGATIHRSNDPDRTGESFGYFFAVKRWDTEYVARLRSITGCQVETSWPVAHHESKETRRGRGIVIDVPLLGARGENVAILTAKRAIPALELVTHATYRALSLFVAFAALAFVVLAYGLYRFVGLPLATLTTALDRSDSRLLAPLAKANHEFGNLARLMREFFEHRASMLQEVERRRASEIELARIGRRNEAASQARTKLFAEVSHEIRSPLTGVIGMVELLADTDLSPQQREFVTTIQSSASAMLGTLNDVLDLAKIEEGKVVLEQTDFDLRAAIEEVLALFAAQAQAKGLELAAIVPFDAQTWLSGDPGRIRQILINLVGNAIKYTAQGEVVIEASAVPIDADRFKVAIAVRDTGVGIPPDRLGAIFEAFEQASASDTRRFGGTGLGLTISRQFARLLGGELSVASAVGEGSTFTLECALRRASVARDGEVVPARARAIVASHSATFRRAVVAQTRALGCSVIEADGLGAVTAALESSVSNLGPAVLIFDYRRDDGSFGEQIKLARKAAVAGRCGHVLAAVTFSESAALSAVAAASGIELLARPIASRSLIQALVRVAARTDETRRTSRPAADSATLRGLRVLIAESYPPTQRLLLDHGRELGLEVVLATDGELALEQLGAERFDAAILDLRLLGLDGLEVARRWRDIERGRGASRLPIVALNAQERDRESWTRAGVDVAVRNLANGQSLAAALSEAIGSELVAPVPG